MTTGSSPRLRGTPGRSPAGSCGQRLIPAPAGNPKAFSGLSGVKSAHPRACGEPIIRAKMVPFDDGSSPRLRGTPPFNALLPNASRLIPAPAGNPTTWRSARNTTTAHPRACGEPYRLTWATCYGIGSSPRLRGTPALRRATADAVRLIPAPAGNPRHHDPIRRLHAAHPRACGEPSACVRSTRSAVGSSPRLRGTQVQARHGVGR